MNIYEVIEMSEKDQQIANKHVRDGELDNIQFVHFNKKYQPPKFKKDWKVK